MTRRELLDRCAADGDERLLLSRIWDRYDQCALRGIPSHTEFLSPAEQAAARRLMSVMGVHSGFVFFGGYEDAERCQLHFLPEWAEEPDTAAVCALRCRWYHTEKLTHRDFLGSLMGLGLTREKIGDILVSDESADVLVSDDISAFLLTEWTQAGRTALRVKRIALSELAVPEKNCRMIRDTVASLRLDSIVSTAFGMSRARAAEQITAGHVQVNWVLCTKTDKPVAQGDTITLRGFGKCEVDTVGSPTKKGRYPVGIRRYM